MGKETVVSEGEALGRELNSNHFLDLSLKPNSISIKELVETLIERIAEAREQSPSNQRKQRKSAIEQQRYILGRLISNFVYNHEKGVDYGFFIPVNKSIAFKKNDENINRFHNLQLKYVLDMLASNKLNLIKVSKAKFKNNNSYFNECTIIKADIKMHKLINLYELSINDIKKDEKKSYNIILKSRKKDYFDTKKNLNYNYNKFIRDFNDDIDYINNALLKPIITYQKDSKKIVFTSKDLTLYRYFDGNFKSGGRLFQGLWQSMKKKDRETIRIDGHKTATLDYSQMNPNLLYGIEGETPPLDDCYEIQGFEKNRNGIKKVFNSLLFRKTPMNQFPKNTKLLFGKNTKVEEVIDKIYEAHPKISKYFNTEIGFHLFYLESSLCINVLKNLIKNKIIALPIHDAFLVKKDCMELTKKIMCEEFSKNFKNQIKVKLD